MEIVIGIIVAFIAFKFLAIYWNIKSTPDPASMSMEALLERMQFEGSWIEKYKLLPYEYQQKAGITKKYEGKKLYAMQLTLEFMKRGLEASGKRPEETTIPFLERFIELMQNGMSEEEANKRAAAEFVQNRDAGLSNQPERAA